MKIAEVFGKALLLFYVVVYTKKPPSFRKCQNKLKIKQTTIQKHQTLKIKIKSEINKIKLSSIKTPLITTK